MTHVVHELDEGEVYIQASYHEAETKDEANKSIGELAASLELVARVERVEIDKA